MTALLGGAVLRGAVGLLVHGGLVLAVASLAWRAGLLRRRPAVWAAIWTVVLIKLVLPWGPSIAGSLADLWAMLWGSADVLSGRVGAQPGAVPAAREAVAWTDWLATAAVALWALLAARRMGAAVVGFARRHRQLAAIAVRTPPPPWAEALCRDLAERFAVATPQLVVHPEPVVPHLLYGLRRSLLVVPATLLADRQLLELALAHELAHLQRRDPLARWLQTGVAAVWFFLPIRQLIGRQLERAQEAAADALAARRLALDPPTYARLLVDTTLRCQRPAQLVGAVSLASPGSLVERVEALCVRGSHATAGWLGAVVVVGSVVIMLGQARPPAVARAASPCEYSPALAEALREVHPEADRDGDGELGRDEACALQEQLRRAARDGLELGGDVAEAGPSPPLWQRLCCNCENPSAPAVRTEPLADRAAPQACEQE